METRKRLLDWIANHTTQREFAAELGITEAYLSQVLHGRRTPRLPILMDIEDKTGVTVRSWALSSIGKEHADRRKMPSLARS